MNKIKMKILVVLLTVMACINAKGQDYSQATLQLRTNGLYDIALCPSIGGEIQIENNIAFQLDYVGAWWNKPSKNRFFSNYGFQAGARYYFDDKNNSKPYTGWHTGIYGQMATFDFEFGGEGVQCPNLDESWGIGMEGGYCKPLNDSWSLDFTLGIGYFTSKYHTYNPAATQKKYLRSGTKRLKYFGPTRAEVTLVWNINKKNTR